MCDRHLGNRVLRKREIHRSRSSRIASKIITEKGYWSLVTFDQFQCVGECRQQPMDYGMKKKQGTGDNSKWSPLFFESWLGREGMNEA